MLSARVSRVVVGIACHAIFHSPLWLYAALCTIPFCWSTSCVARPIRPKAGFNQCLLNPQQRGSNSKIPHSALWTAFPSSQSQLHRIEWERKATYPSSHRENKPADCSVKWVSPILIKIAISLKINHILLLYDHPGFMVSQWLNFFYFFKKKCKLKSNFVTKVRCFGGHFGSPKMPFSIHP